MPAEKKQDASRTLQACLKQPPEACFILYGDLIDSQPTAAHVPARALREHARAGRMTSEHIGPLLVALSSATDPSCITDLAKALAAFGREAQPAVPFVVEKLMAVNVLDDESFWVFDSLLFVLGFLGGEEAVAAIEAIKAESPPRVLRAKDLFRGEWDAEIREELFNSTIDRVARMAKKENFVGGWANKQTDHEVDDKPAEPPPKMSPWMTR